MNRANTPTSPFLSLKTLTSGRSAGNGFIRAKRVGGVVCEQSQPLKLSVAPVVSVRLTVSVRLDCGIRDFREWITSSRDLGANTEERKP
jgi:hypothetical protein